MTTDRRLGECSYCSTPAPKLYRLPERAARDPHVDGPACHFCYVRRAAIRPTRNRMVWPTGENSPSR